MTINNKRKVRENHLLQRMIKGNFHKGRRDFARSLLGASVVGALGPVGQLALMRAAAASTAPTFTDYKALVCIFLYGGNDSFNMLVPTGAAAGSGYNSYQTVRGDLAVSNTALITGGTTNPYDVDGTEESAYRKGLYTLTDKNIDLGVNAVMPELADLIKANKATIIGNVGNLVVPVTRSEIEAKTANLPVFLFTHNHQQRALQTGQGNNLHDVGWAGRIADNWDGINNNSELGLNISYAGLDRMMIGHNSAPLALQAGEIAEFTNMQFGADNEQNDRRALFKALAGLENTSASGNIAFNSTNTYTTSDPFKNLYGHSSRKSLDVFDLLYNAWGNHTVSYSRTDSYGNPLFSVPGTANTGFSDDLNGGLIKDLETVAKMIDIGANNAFSNPVGSKHNRQIFMVKLGGFDTHSSQISKHPLLLRELSLALGKFQAALEELGHVNKVTTFTMSDFGRTMSNNGDGTDHAWGAHHLVVGGDGSGSSGNLRGGQMIGTLPDVSLGGADDYSTKGRIIPTTAQDQLNATLCRWFGVDDSLMPTIFPNLGNFGTIGSGVGSAYLGDLFA